MSASGETDDLIHIEQLELAARIGVPDEEREQAQRLTASITIWPLIGFGQMGDRIESTVDYAAVCGEVKQFVAARSDKLIETLAEEIALRLLGSFPVRKVRLELRKFILPDVSHVAVVLVRERTADA